MAIVFSKAHPDRYTPEHRRDEDPAPVYLLVPLTWRERAAWHADVVRAGGGRPMTEGAVAEAVKQAVVDLAPENQDELVEAIENYRDAATAAAASGGSVPDDIAKPFAAIEERLRGHPLVAELAAARMNNALLAGPAAAARALIGWEHVGLRFERRNGVVPDEVLSMIPEDDLYAVGRRAIELMRPGDREKKSSDSPSPSQDDPKISPLHPDPEKPGPSSETNTILTLAS